MTDMEKFYYDLIIINLSLPNNSFGKIVLALTFHIFIKKHLSKENYTLRNHVQINILVELIHFIFLDMQKYEMFGFSVQLTINFKELKYKFRTKDL